MSWGETKSIAGSSQLFATQIKQNINPVFFDFQDTILLIDKGQKKVSSTLGHQLMEHHPYASTRFTQAHQHMEKLLQILKSGDLDAFVELVELEALTLHALMMASQPYFILMQPNTLAVINKIWEFRAQSKHPLSFTLDAGANIHLLYPKVIKLQVKEFIEAELKFFCQNDQYIEDQVGSGAKKG
jgi:diphosphomevalonate decarboxylase